MKTLMSSSEIFYLDNLNFTVRWLDCWWSCDSCQITAAVLGLREPCYVFPPVLDSGVTAVSCLGV